MILWNRTSYRTEGKACSEQSVLPGIVTNPSAGTHPLISASLKLSSHVKSGIQHILHYWSGA